MVRCWGGWFGHLPGMTQIIRRCILALSLLAGIAPAIAQQFPTVPDGTVIGRIGTGSGSGPSQAIPITRLKTQFGISQKPIVILASGQSNFERIQPYPWLPNSLAKLWNWSGDATVGTTFNPISSTNVNITWKFASDIADSTSRPICLINISISGLAISHWLSGTSAPDMYQNILANVPGALAACGASKIDLFLWWQGEADTAPLNASYPQDFATMMSRLWGNSWFPQETPVIIHSIASTAISGNSDGDHMNALLLGVVNADPDKRRYLYTAALSTATYWDAGLPGHMTGQGYFSAGALSSSAFLNGPGRNSVKNMVVDPASGAIVFGFQGFSSASMAGNYNGFGVTLPATTGLWQLAAPNAQAGFQIIDSFGNFSGYVARRANGTLASKTRLSADDLIASFGAQGYDASGAYSSGNKAAFNCYASENWTDATHHGTYCAIFNTVVGTDGTQFNALFQPGSMSIFGTTSGSVKFAVPAVAGANTITWPAGTTDFSATGGTSQVVKQTSSGGAFTVAQVAATDLSGLGSGVATFLGTPSSANLRAALTDETGSGLAYFQGGDIGTPSAGVGTNLTALNASNLGSGTVPAARMPALTGDATSTVGTVATTVTKINGVDQTTAWTTYTPTGTASVPGGTPPTIVCTGRSKTLGKSVFAQADCTISAAGTGSGLLQVTLPTAAAAFNYVGVAKEYQATGKSGVAQVLASGTQMVAADGSGTTFIVTGNKVNFGMTYEVP